MRSPPWDCQTVTESGNVCAPANELYARRGRRPSGETQNQDGPAHPREEPKADAKGVRPEDRADESSRSGLRHPYTGSSYTSEPRSRTDCTVV